MNAYTSSSSSRAMSVARAEVGSCSTWPGSGADSSDVIARLGVKVPAEQVGGARPPHVRAERHRENRDCGQSEPCPWHYRCRLLEFILRIYREVPEPVCRLRQRGEILITRVSAGAPGGGARPGSRCRPTPGTGRSRRAR